MYLVSQEAVVCIVVFCYSMMNVGVQCCKRSGVPISIRAREKIRVDPFGSKNIFNFVAPYRYSNRREKIKEISLAIDEHKEDV